MTTNTTPSGADALRKELIADLREVFDASGQETPQIVRDVIEYADSWLSVYIQKGAESAALSAAQDAPQPAAQQGIDERGAFESIFKSDCGVTFDRDKNGFYKRVFVGEAWKVWQARAALAAQAQEAPLLARIAELEAELEKTKAIFAASCNHAAVMEMDRDARRYRWLCEHHIVPSPSLWDDGIGFVCKLNGLTRRGTTEKATLDAAIDAAMKDE